MFKEMQECLLQSNQILKSRECSSSGRHLLGWRNIWDSAEYWSWVERPKGAGGIELWRVLNCILQVVFLHQVHWTAIQPAPAGWLQHIAGNGEKSNLDSIHHLCQHCYTGDEDVMYQQFTSIGPFFADSVQTEYCPTFLLSVCSCVRHRRDISHFSHI